MNKSVSTEGREGESTQTGRREEIRNAPLGLSVTLLDLDSDVKSQLARLGKVVSHGPVYPRDGRRRGQHLVGEAKD